MRLFAAVELDDKARGDLAAIADKLRRRGGARWTPPENYHLTLRFFGECDTTTADSLLDDLRRLGPPPGVSLPLVGPRYFPNRRDPRILIALAEAPEDLYAYQREVERAARGAGLEPAARPFTPHVTLARLRDGGAARGLAARAEALAGRWTAFEVRSTVLMESVSGPEGVRYRTLGRFG